MIVGRNDVGSVLSYLEQQDVLSVDTETTGLGWNDRLFSIEIASKDKEYHFDKRVLEEDFHRLHTFFHTCKCSRWYLMNAKFDMRMLHWEGISLRGEVIDLEVLARLDKNDMFSTSLEAIAKAEGMEKLKVVEKYIDDNKLYSTRTNPYWDKQEKLKHFDRVPISLLGEYAAHDARITFDLCERLLARIDERVKPVLENEVALTRVCFDMEMHGVLTNRDYAEKMLHLESGLIREAKGKFLLATGYHYDGSRKQLLEVFTKAGEEIPRTEKGNLSLTDDVLSSFTSPAAKIVQDIRHYEKRISTYYSTFLDLVDSQGFIHPDMRQAGTTTGRFSYREPNLQQLSKEDEPEDLVKPNLIRRCFIPEPGHTLVSADYSQLEYRIMLAYANQRNMVDEVMGGKDLHQATADLVGITRKHAKTLNFAVLYGAGSQKIADTLGIREVEASLLKARYLSNLPQVNQLIHNIISTVRARGHVYNWLGRKLQLPGGLREAAYAVPNHLIQGSGGDLCKLAMVQLHPWTKEHGIKMTMNVHDQLVFQVPNDQLDKVSHIKETMENAWPEKNGMRMKVDMSYSTVSLAEADMKKGLPSAHA